jgi:acylphosphatase
MKKRVHVWISGLVQGVMFRASLKEEADKRDVKGWVRNTENGVEAVFEGEHDKIAELVEWCRKGPKYAKVKEVKEKEEIFTGEFKEFRILHF